MGPLSGKTQFEKVRRLIKTGIEEGATLVCGGADAPRDKGYFVQPTVFADVNNDMTVAREEIFGPVLCILPYDSEDDAVRIANDTPYGLAAYVESGDRGPCAQDRGPSARRKRLRQRRAGGSGSAVRRLQTLRQRPRGGRVRVSRNTWK